MNKAMNPALTYQRGRGLRSPPPASVVTAILKVRPDTRLLALWLADIILVQHMKWSAAVPLLAAHLRRNDLRMASGQHTDPVAWRAACAGPMHEAVRRLMASMPIWPVAPNNCSTRCKSCVARMPMKPCCASLPPSLQTTHRGVRLKRRGNSPSSPSRRWCFQQAARSAAVRAALWHAADPLGGLLDPSIRQDRLHRHHDRASSEPLHGLAS